LAFLIVKEENVAHEGESNYINTSGIYDLTLKNAEAVTTANGAVQVNYFFDRCTSYGNNIIGTSGQPTFGYDILEALAVILGVDELSDPEPTIVQFKKEAKELNCIPELSDVAVKAWVQFTYKMYKGEVQERISIRRFYRDSDGASGSEIISGENIGSRLEKDSSYANEVKYEEGATEEVVQAWKKAKMSNNTSTSTESKPKTSIPAKNNNFPDRGALAKKS